MPKRSAAKPASTGAASSAEQGLAAVGAAVGGAIPFAANMPGGMIPAAMAQSAPPAPAAPKGPQYLKYPGKSDKLVLLGDRPLVAETPENMLDDDTTPTEKFFVRNNGTIPEESKDAGLVEDDG